MSKSNEEERMQHGIPLKNKTKKEYKFLEEVIAFPMSNAYFVSFYYWGFEINIITHVFFFIFNSWQYVLHVTGRSHILGMDSD